MLLSFKINARKQNVAEDGANERNRHIFRLFKLRAAEVEFWQDKPEGHKKYDWHSRAYAIRRFALADDLARAPQDPASSHLADSKTARRMRCRSCPRQHR